MQTGSIHLDTIGQIALTVSDLTQSKDFYQNILGMKLLFDAGQMVFFQCGAVRLMIATPENEKPTTPAGTVLYFRVPEIYAAYAALQAKGVEFVQPPDLIAKMPDHDLWMAFLKDPTGNLIGLMCEVARSAEQ